MLHHFTIKKYDHTNYTIALVNSADRYFFFYHGGSKAYFYMISSPPESQFGVMKQIQHGSIGEIEHTTSPRY